MSSLPDLDAMKEPISRSEEHIYQLKLRLVFLSAKVNYFNRRNQMYCVKFTNDYLTVGRIINLIFYSKVLEYLMSIKIPLTEKQLRSARAIRNVLQSYLFEAFEETSKSYQEMLKPDFSEIVMRAGFLDNLEIPCEICSICGDEIPASFVNCASDHPSGKCAISSLTIMAVDEGLHCKICNRTCLPFEDLLTLFPGTVEYRTCPVCDIEFENL
jgi:hypothetical protein